MLPLSMHDEGFNFIHGEGAVRGNLAQILKSAEIIPAVSYVLDAGHCFLYCNPAWDDFARANGGSHLAAQAVLGTNLFDVIPDALYPYYSDAFQQVAKDGAVWEGAYQCSSPALYREYQMRIHLLERQRCFLVTNPLILERPHSCVAKPDPDTYWSSDGHIMMCIHCRCSRHVDRPDRWDFVPEYLDLDQETRLKVSHGFCPICQACYYPDPSSRPT